MMKTKNYPPLLEHEGLTPFSLFVVRTIGVLAVYYVFNFLIFAAGCLGDWIHNYLSGG